MRILICVTHLLGAGHLTRAAALARAFSARDHSVTLVSGGAPAKLIPVDGLEFIQLPPVRTQGTDFKTLLDDHLRPVDQERLSARRELLLATLDRVRPDVVVTELFPFGRRVLADEFLTLLQAARHLAPRPLVASSIRDILAAPRKPERIAQTHERLSRFYDLVLVHGDPDLAPLDASWPMDAELRAMVRYTGYVDEGAPVAAAGERSGVIVSGGSSAASLPLYRASLEAARNMTDEPWLLLVGNGVPEADFADLRAAACDHVRVERARRDFRALLGRAALSISQAGYNTVVDLLRSEVRPILVPFEAGQETEQRQRAERLQSCGLADMVTEAELTGERLARAVRDGLARPQRSRPVFALDGAARSVSIVEDFAAAPAVAQRADWSPLDDALSRARDMGRMVGFWWRDDDAVADTPELDRLLQISRRYEAPLAIAAIPYGLHPSLAARLEDAPTAAALVHGFRHRNHAHAGEKKAEFGRHRSLAEISTEIGEALHVAASRLGSRLLPVLVPPWNRIAPELVATLPGAGYVGLSTFGDRPAHRAAPGLPQVNTHVDPIDWHATRSLRDPRWIVLAMAEAVERRLDGRADAGEPIGILTHHLVHDEAVWQFVEEILDSLSRNNVRFFAPSGLFSGPTGSRPSMHFSSTALARRPEG